MNSTLLSSGALRYAVSAALAGLLVLGEPAVAQDAAPDPELLRLQQETARFNAELARSNAEKAAIEARAAAAMAPVNAIPANAYGATTLANGAGAAESTVLSVEAIHDVAVQIAATIPAGTRRVLLLTNTEVPDLSQYRLYEARRAVVDEAYVRAMDEAATLDDRLEERLGRHPAPTGTDSMTASLGFAAAVSLAARLGGLFARDVSIGGASLTGDDRLLATSVAGAIRRGSDAPAVYLGTGWMGANAQAPLAAQLNALDAKREEAAGALLTFEALLRDYKSAAEGTNGPRKAAYQACVQEIERTKATIAAAVSAHDALVAWMTTAPSGGSAPFGSIVQQLALADMLGQADSAVMVVHVHGSSQGTMTERSLWTWLGAPAFSVAGSTVVTAQQIGSTDGSLAQAQTYLCDSGYVRMSQIHRPSRREPVRCRRLGD